MTVRRIFMALVWLLLARGSATACVQETPLETEKVIPYIDYSYTTQIMSRLLDSKSMGLTMEYYDFDKQILKTTTEELGSRRTIIDHFAMGYRIISDNGDCYNTTQDISAIFDTAGLRGLGHLLTPGSKHIWKYHKSQIVRGVTLDKWRTCVQNKGSSFTLDYFFTTSDPVPFRIEIQGTLTNSSGTSTSFHSLHDFFLFNKRQKPNSADLLPAPGIICSGDNTSTTPAMPQSAFYRSETIDIEKKTVTEQYVVFNTKDQLSKVVDSTKRIVRDFERGIEYTINTDTKQCVRSPFYRLGRLDRTVDKQGNIHMASLQHFFMDEGNFTYNGIRKARQIPCKVYTKRARSAEMLGDSVVEIYVATGTIQQVKNQIVRVVLKGGKPLAKRKQIEIHEFYPISLWSHSFDIRECFDKDRSTQFKLVFNSGKAEFTLRTRSHLMQLMPTLISQALGIRSLRVIVSSVDAGDGVIVVGGDLFPRENYIELFQAHPGYQFVETSKYHNTKQHLYRNASNTPEICAGYCLNTTTMPFKNRHFYYCQSFEFKRSDHSCNFYFGYSYEIKKKPSKTMDFYTRAERTHHYEKPLRNVWANFQDLVAAGAINYTDSKGNVIKATSVTKVGLTNKAKTDDTAMANPIKQFTVSNGTSPYSKPVEVRKPMTLDACARYCLAVLTYDCRALRYSYTDQQCSLFDYSLRVSNSNGKDKKNPTEMFFTRNYIARFEKIPGRSAIPKKTDNVYSSIKEDNDCAELCVKTQSFYCQSFEKCGDACILGRKHILSVPMTDVKEDKNCVHYSRNYVQDYVKQEHKRVLTDTNAVEISNVGVKKCAQMCSTSSSYDCDVFEFCNADSMCRISTKAISKSSDIQYKDTGDCTLYTRRKDAHRFIPVYSFELTSSADGHSPGDMGGIAIGMIIVGIALIVILALVVFKLKGPSSAGAGGGTVSFGFASRKMSEVDE